MVEQYHFLFASCSTGVLGDMSFDCSSNYWETNDGSAKSAPSTADGDGFRFVPKNDHELYDKNATWTNKRRVHRAKKSQETNVKSQACDSVDKQIRI
jgi:hypothetical protein